ncbi:hypothetical protein HanIR_Chr02g0088751 [Helianthus annuus]|nr:hypothetical protein HanIR_Chr02g0088751 [Helianthus annuus]
MSQTVFSVRDSSKIDLFAPLAIRNWSAGVHSSILYNKRNHIWDTCHHIRPSLVDNFYFSLISFN